MENDPTAILPSGEPFGTSVLADLQFAFARDWHSHLTRGRFSTIQRIRDVDPAAGHDDRGWLPAPVRLLPPAGATGASFAFQCDLPSAFQVALEMRISVWTLPRLAFQRVLLRIPLSSLSDSISFFNAGNRSFSTSSASKRRSFRSSSRSRSSPPLSRLSLKERTTPAHPSFHEERRCEGRHEVSFSRSTVSATPLESLRGRRRRRSKGFPPGRPESRAACIRRRGSPRRC